VTISIGADIGQQVDPTAIAVCEVRPERTGAIFLVRHLERRPLGEPYPAISRRIAEVCVNVVRRVRQARYADGTGDQPEGWLLSSGWDFRLSLYLVLDGTGVGRPVFELVTGALASAGLDDLHAEVTTEMAIFTHGHKNTWANGERRVGKGYLVSRLQSLLQTGRVRLPRTSEAQALAEELQHYEIKVDPDGDAKFGAFRTGKHDDLVTALGLATLEDREPAAPSMVFGPSGRMR
jgi:hypothetical protein